MNEQERQTMIGDDDETSDLRRNPSMILSLRNLVAANDSNDEVDSDDDSFVFTDEIHRDQEFRRVSMALIGLGLITESVPDETGSQQMKGEKGEKTPLLLERNESVNEEEIKVKDKETKEQAPKIGPQQRAYRRGQKELFLEVLDQIDEIERRTRKEKGLRASKFTFGLMNCLMIIYVFGCYPEHFWILYAVETIFWMAYKFRGMYFAKPLSEVLYYLDFCWVMNALGVTLIVLVIVLDINRAYDVIPFEVRKDIFLACFGIFCGPVFFAAMVLPFVAFLFHDVNTTANLIIHLMPSMVMYHLRWHAVEISNAYPTIFPNLVEYMKDINGNQAQSMRQIALAVYFAWFTPYTIWMLLVGLKLPVVSKDKGEPPPKYNTVFHATVKGGMCEMVGSAVWKRPKEISRDCSERNDYELRDFLLYMACHALGSCGLGILLLGDILCFSGGKTVHASLLWLATIISAKRGADRYTYYVTRMYGQKLRKAFKKIEVHE